MLEPYHEVTVVYIHVPGDGIFLQKTRRFVETYQRFPPGYPHRMVVVSQNREPYPDVVEMLSGLGKWELFLHDNSAKDIGAFMAYAKVCASPMMVCLSGTTYFRREGWLKRMRDAFDLYRGVGLFGACGNSGTAWCDPHIRTSSFWCAPELLLAYPVKITRDDQRYPFEHGNHSLTVWVKSLNLPAVVVDFSGHYDFGHWNDNQRGYHRGDQHDLLVGDRNTEPPEYPHP